MELLQTFMECSIAILAFSAIVSEFRKQSKAKWNVRLYQGIIAHTIQAFVYSGLPLLAAAFSVNENSIWTTCGLILGGVTFIQGIGVMVSDKDSNPKVKWILFLFSTSVLALQFLYTFGFLASGIGVYSIGVFWHLLQALVIISMFMLNPGADE